MEQIDLSKVTGDKDGLNLAGEVVLAVYKTYIAKNPDRLDGTGDFGSRCVTLLHNIWGTEIARKRLEGVSPPRLRRGR